MVLALLLGSGCSPAGDPAPQPESTEEVAEHALTYLRGRQLVRLDLGADREEVLGRVPSPDVHPVPNRPDRFLLTEDRGAGEDFAQDPILSLMDDAGHEQVSLGPGFSPLVDPSGARVAYLRSVGGRVCEGEVCLGSVSVEIAELDGTTRRLLPPGDWHLLSWAGDDLLVSSGGVTHRVAPSGSSETLDLTPSEIWGVTPDGGEILLSRRGGVELRELGTGAVRRLDVAGLLAEGEWSPNGDELVAVVVSGGDTELVRIRLSDGSVERIRSSEDAMGPVLWSLDGSFAYVRADGLQLEAIVCDRDVDCRPVLRWDEGIVPLSLR